MNRDLGILLPSNRPERFIHELLPTLRHIQEIAYCSRFLINFQPPWGQPEMDLALREIKGLGFEVEHVFTPESQKPIQIGRIRQQCASLWENAPYYLQIDDDFRFNASVEEYLRNGGGHPLAALDYMAANGPKTSGQRYKEALTYMRENPKCGAIVCKGFSEGDGQGDKISVAYNDCWYYTGKGLFLRNPSLSSQHDFNYLPDCCMNLRGALVDDYLTVLHRCEIGLYPAKSFNFPTIHQGENLSFYGDDLWAMHSVHLIEREAGKHIERTFCPDWTLGNSNDDAKNQMLENPVHYSVYRSGGGPDLGNIQDWDPN